MASTGSGRVRRCMGWQMKNGGFSAMRCSLLCGGCQHFLGNIRTDDAIAALRQQHGHRAGAAGKVQHGLWRMPRALQDGLEKLQHGGIVHIGRQPVIRARERFIGLPCFGAHFFSSASTFAKARS